MVEEMSRLIIIDEDGQKIECEILLTFKSKEYDKNYVIFSPIGEEYIDEDGYPEIQAASYIPGEDGEGVLTSIDDDDEWDMVEDEFDLFIESLEYEEEDYDSISQLRLNTH